MNIYEVIAEPDDEGIDRAVDALKGGKLVAFPTETVYGLGADARNGVAVASIYEAKGRPRFNPLIVHVADMKAAQTYGIFSSQASELADAFWPGALTLVVPRREQCGLSELVSAGLGTVALRVPDHPVARNLLKRFQGPIAAPSANPSGRISPTEAEHVAEGLGKSVAVILDGDACPLGLESTIIGFEDDGKAVLLRPGGIARNEIEAVLGVPLKDTDSGDGLKAPGMLASHYAPRARMRLNAGTPREGEMLLAFGSNGPKDVPGLNLSPSGNLKEAAANLFAYLHMLDDTGCGKIAVMPIPREGLGEAINDRLARAAAPRKSRS